MRHFSPSVLRQLELILFSAIVRVRSVEEFERAEQSASRRYDGDVRGPVAHAVVVAVHGVSCSNQDCRRRRCSRRRRRTEIGRHAAHQAARFAVRSNSGVTGAGDTAHWLPTKTTSSAIAEGPRDASCQLKSCQLPRNNAETTCTTSAEQIEVMRLGGGVKVGGCVINVCTQQ